MSSGKSKLRLASQQAVSYFGFHFFSLLLIYGLATLFGPETALRAGDLRLNPICEFGLDRAS